MQRTITEFQKDDAGHWAAMLDCGHTRHVRHDPPWQVRAWVLTEEGRKGFVGTVMECKKCDALLDTLTNREV